MRLLSFSTAPGAAVCVGVGVIKSSAEVREIAPGKVTGFWDSGWEEGTGNEIIKTGTNDKKVEINNQLSVALRPKRHFPHSENYENRVYSVKEF